MPASQLVILQRVTGSGNEKACESDTVAHRIVMAAFLTLLQKSCLAEVEKSNWRIVDTSERGRFPRREWLCTVRITGGPIR